MQSVRAAYEEPDQANAAVQALLDVGFPSDEIRVSEREHGAVREVPVIWYNKARRWGGWASAVGAVLGAAAALALPYVVPPASTPDILARMLSDQPILAALQGAFLGGVSLGTLAATMGMGVRRTKAPASPQAQRIWVGIETEQGDVERATRALRDTGAMQLERG